jgi:hypothetical protein
MFRVRILVVLSALVGVAMVMAPTTPLWARQTKVTICHFDEETLMLKAITIPTATAEKHLAQHPNDTSDLTQCPGAKVMVCHMPPGNPSNAHTIAIEEGDVADHLAHGDSLGPCS